MGRVYTTSGIILNNNSTGTIINNIGIISNLNFIRDIDIITGGTITTGTFSTITGLGGTTSVNVVTTSPDEIVIVYLQAIGYNIENRSNVDYLYFGGSNNIWCDAYPPVVYRARLDAAHRQLYNLTICY